MRLNKYIALATGMSRRAADTAIEDGRVRINDQPAVQGWTLETDDVVTLDGRAITPAVKATIMLNKPTGYVCSRDGQGSRTVYDLLPKELHNLKPVGRLDKESSGLLLLTNDGDLANELTHPSKQKVKIYQAKLNHPLQPLHRQMISDFGVQLEDGGSKLGLERMIEGDDHQWLVTMSEGRNRQIRRTFGSLGYDVLILHRTSFGQYALGDLENGKYRNVN